MFWYELRKKAYPSCASHRLALIVVAGGWCKAPASCFRSIGCAWSSRRVHEWFFDKRLRPRVWNLPRLPNASSNSPSISLPGEGVLKITRYWFFGNLPVIACKTHTTVDQRLTGYYRRGGGSAPPPPWQSSLPRTHRMRSSQAEPSLKRSFWPRLYEP